MCCDMIPNGKKIHYSSLALVGFISDWGNSAPTAEIKGCVNKMWVIEITMCCSLKGEIAPELWDSSVVCEVNFRKAVVNGIPMLGNSVFDLLDYLVFGYFAFSSYFKR